MLGLLNRFEPIVGTTVMLLPWACLYLAGWLLVRVRKRQQSWYSALAISIAAGCVGLALMVGYVYLHNGC